MRLWIDTFDGNNNRLGSGPVEALASAEVSRSLDGAGSFHLRCPATDLRALTLLQKDRRIQIWGEDTAGKRLRGEGIIKKRAITETQSGATLRVEGPDILRELQQRNVLLGRIFNQATLQTVANNLIGLVPNWSVSVDAGIANKLVDARYDGVNVLKAFRDLAKRYNYHIRVSQENSRTLEVGPFGADSGLRVHKVETITQETLANPKLLMVEQIQAEEDSEEVYNVLVPIGAGEGEAALTLAKSTRSIAGGYQYDILTEAILMPDGVTKTFYFIAADGITSLSDPNVIIKVGQFKEIAPLSNSDADLRNAADALYDGAVVDLNWHKQAQVRYALTVKKAVERIQPGDTVHVNYKARIHTDDGPVDYLDVRGDFFVLTAREAIRLEGTVVDLEISNVDRHQESEAEMVLDAVEAIELRNLKPNIVGGPPRTYVYDRDIAASLSAVIPLEFTDATLECLRVRFRLVTGPLRNFLSVTGGSHKHRVAVTQHTLIDPIGSYTGRVMTAAKPNGDAHSIIIPNASDDDLWTEGASGSLTLNVGSPQDDSQTPTQVTVEINGVNKTQELFGSATLAPSGGALNLLADVGALTNLIVNAPGGLRQVHNLTVKCASGRGRIEATLEVFETTQMILRA